MNSGVNASLRFAFTTKVERGAFYNRKQVRKESKGVCLSKGVKSKKGCLIIKRVLSKKGVKSKKGCTWKKEKGEKKNKKKTKTRLQKKGIW